MALVVNAKANTTLRYWKASLAWKNIGNWARGWTQESFIKELRELCNDNGNVGAKSDQLLNDMVHDRERRELDTPGTLVHLHSKTKIVGNCNKATGGDVLAKTVSL